VKIHRPLLLKTAVCDGFSPGNSKALFRLANFFIGGAEHASRYCAYWNGTDEYGNTVASRVYFVQLSQERDWVKKGKIIYLR